MKLVIASAVLLLLVVHGANATPSHINNQEQAKGSVDVVSVAVADESQTVEAKANEQVQEVQEPSPQPQIVPVTEPQPVGCEQYRSLLNQYDWNVNTILAIMNAESSCNTYAVGDNYPINGLYAPSCGLLQIRTLSSRPTCDQLKDPATNIAWGYKIYTSQGYGAWSVCKYKVACY